MTRVSSAARTPTEVPEKQAAGFQGWPKAPVLNMDLHGSPPPAFQGGSGPTFDQEFGDTVLPGIVWPQSGSAPGTRWKLDPEYSVK